MAKARPEIVAYCPQAKCNKPIYADHSNSWCIECGEPLPATIQEKIPRLFESAAKASEMQLNSGALKIVDAQSLESRYRDAYAVAGTIIKASEATKPIGLIIGILLIASSFTVDLGSVVVGALMAAVVASASFYVAGVMISAQGQLLRATIDSAVNGSTLLNNEQKARILGLG